VPSPFRWRRAAAIAVALAAAAFPASAAIVVLAEGGTLKVERYEVRGDTVKLGLPDGGFITLPLARVERIVDDELVPAGSGAARTPRGASALLAFHPRAQVPRTPYGQLIYDTAKRHQLNPALIAAMAQAESAFDPNAVSSRGARGLMQVMPATGDRFGIREEHLFRPDQNLEAAARYLGWLRGRFGSDLARILAAYNAGEANVDRYNGVPPFRETRDYIRRVYSVLQVADTTPVTAD
jgi:soluble lytic murein transglycosylase-like protein